jgi:hypothetical protein
MTPLCLLFHNRAHATETSQADHCRARVATTRFIGWFRGPLQPHYGHKREVLLPRTTDTKPRIRLSSTSPSPLFFLQLVLATLPLAHLSRLLHSSPSKLFFRLRRRRRGEA